MQLALGSNFGKHKETRKAKFVIKTIIYPVSANVALSPCRRNTFTQCQFPCQTQYEPTKERNIETPNVTTRKIKVFGLRYQKNNETVLIHQSNLYIEVIQICPKNIIIPICIRTFVITRIIPTCLNFTYAKVRPCVNEEKKLSKWNPIAIHIHFFNQQ